MSCQCGLDLSSLYGSSCLLCWSQGVCGPTEAEAGASPVQLWDCLLVRLLAALPRYGDKPEAPLYGTEGVGLNGFDRRVHLRALGLRLCLVIGCFSSVRP